MNNTPSLSTTHSTKRTLHREFDEVVADLADSTEPLARLALLTELHEAHEAEERREVLRARDDNETWEDIGKSLGISKQAAHKRFGCPRLGDEEVEAPRPRKTRAKAWTVTTPGGRALVHVSSTPVDKLEVRAPVLAITEDTKGPVDSLDALAERDALLGAVRGCVKHFMRWWNRSAHQARPSTIVDGVNKG